MEGTPNTLEKPEASVKKDIWTQNETLLQKRHYIGEFAFHRAGLKSFEKMLEQSRAGERDAGEVFMYIVPSRIPPGSYPEASTLYNLGYRIVEETHCFETLEGLDKQEELENLQKVNTAYEDIRKSLGLPDPNVLRKDQHGNLEPAKEKSVLSGSDVDLTQTYIEQVNALYDFYESHFDPEAVIDYSQTKIANWRQYLNEGVNPKTGNPLTSSQKKRAKRFIKAFEENIERNRKKIAS